jgi:hypothetical protein
MAKIGKVKVRIGDGTTRLIPVDLKHLAQTVGWQFPICKVLR